jgi:hypothetical protein
LVGSLVLAAAFGAVRAFTVRIWLHDGQPLVQGDWLTAALWVAFGAHLGYYYLIGQHKDIGAIGSATVLLAHEPASTPSIHGRVARAG